MRLLLAFLLVALCSAAGLVRAQVACCAAQGGVTGACSIDGHVVCQDGTSSASCLCPGGVSPPPATLGQLLMPLTTAFGAQVKGTTGPVTPLTVTGNAP